MKKVTEGILLVLPFKLAFAIAGIITILLNIIDPVFMTTVGNSVYSVVVTQTTLAAWHFMGNIIFFFATLLIVYSLGDNMLNWVKALWGMFQERSSAPAKK